MISTSALELLVEWYRRSGWLLGLLLVAIGIAVILGAHLEASTVFPGGLLSWVGLLAGLLVFTFYTYVHTLWVSEVVGHFREIGLEEHLVRFVKVFLFYVLMITASYFLTVVGYSWIALVLWVLLLLYPYAVIVDNLSELDNVRSSLEAWRHVPGVLLEYFVTGSVLLLTSFYLEVALGWMGLLLSIFVTVFFTVPFLTTLLALSYLLRYPLTQRALFA